MARGDVRIAVTLACEECKRRNYQTNKSKRNNPDTSTRKKHKETVGGGQRHERARPHSPTFSRVHDANGVLRPHLHVSRLGWFIKHQPLLLHLSGGVAVRVV